MRRKKDNEPLWCQLYRQQVIKPAQQQRDTEQKGRTAASQAGFYNTTAWKRLRDQRRRANPLCQHCEQRGFIRPMKVVDHIKPIDERKDLALSFDNTQSLCDFCHGVKTKADAKAKKQTKKLQRGKILMKQLESRDTPGG